MEWGAATGVGASSAGLLLLPASDFLSGFVGAYAVLVAAAFVAVALLGPSQEPVLRRAIRAGLIAGVATVALASVQLGGSVWDALHWEARRQASAAMRGWVEIEPRTFAVYGPGVGFGSDTLPATLALP